MITASWYSTCHIHTYAHRPSHPIPPSISHPILHPRPPTSSMLWCVCLGSNKDSYLPSGLGCGRGEDAGGRPEETRHGQLGGNPSNHHSNNNYYSSNILNDSPDSPDSFSGPRLDHRSSSFTLFPIVLSPITVSSYRSCIHHSHNLKNHELFLYWYRTLLSMYSATRGQKLTSENIILTFI